MRIFQGFDDIDSIYCPAVTLGSFDGVHAGHKCILNQLKSEAQRISGQSVVITFDPHPHQVICPDKSMGLLTTLDEKAELLDSHGIDNLLVINFNDQFRRISSEEFVRDYLVGKLGIKSMIVGYNHHFGHNRSGSYDHLEPLHNELGFALTKVNKFDNGSGKISSTEVRKLLNSGQVDIAAKLLEYQYFISGSVDLNGKFAINSNLKIIPCEGTYQVMVNGNSMLVKIDSKKQITLCGNIPEVTNIKIQFLKKID
jgi:riboflavin kinase/FMN adenylyltransferase